MITTVISWSLEPVATLSPIEDSRPRVSIPIHPPSDSSTSLKMNDACHHLYPINRPRPFCNRFLGRIAFALPLLCFLLGSLSSFAAETTEKPVRPKGKLFEDDSFFPIAVWLQQPRNAERFKAAGINLYVGLYRGPNKDQIEQLEKAGMPVICHQNSFALENKENPIFAAWMHGDEPDNAQPLPRGQSGWGPPILPEKIQEDYERLRAGDPSRSIFLNLGQGVAWDNWIGRGVRRNHPEDYPEYIKGGDIISFDIYPVVHDSPEVAGKLEFVARGVQRLRDWSEGKKTIWNCIECARIDNPDKIASPEQIRSEVWMSIIHGSQGIIYFVHQFKPTFKEASVLEDPITLEAITKINAQIKELAPVLNSPTINGRFTVKSSVADVPIATMTKEKGGATYLFTVSMANNETTGTFSSPALPGSGNVEVLGENRTIPITNRTFRDNFRPYAPHLYKITDSSSQ